jgi:predicted RNA-binding protein
VKRRTWKYKPRKRNVNHKRNLSYLHAEEERIITRDVCAKFGTGVFSAASLRLAFPMRYHPTLVRTALKRMKKKRILKPVGSTKYEISRSYYDAYEAGREAA